MAAMMRAMKKCFKSRYYYSGKARPMDQEMTVIDQTALILTDLKRRGCLMLGGATQGSAGVGQRERPALWFSQEGRSGRVSRFRAGFFQ